MDLSFPEKYYEVAKYFDFYIGDLEQTPLLTDAQRLLFYALRQQAEHGPCNSPQPSMWYLTERHKHQAWKQLGRMSSFEAMVFFVQQFERVLWSLEHPDDVTPAAETAIDTSVNWRERLRELGPDTPDAAVSPCAAQDAPSHQSVKEPASSGMAEEPPAVVEPTTAQPSPPPACLAEEETRDWDDDVKAHSTASIDSVRYLAAEVMRLRHALKHATTAAAAAATTMAEPAQVAATQPVEAAPSCSHSPPLNPAAQLPPLKISVLPPPPPHVTLGEQSGAAAPASMTPPLKPVWTANGTAARIAAIPPPVRLSARSMTEAAVRTSYEVVTAKSAAPVPAATVTDEARTSWFAW